jgi:two-component system, sensor histidine kinase and response regulator
MHKLLTRQLKRHLGPLAADPRLEAFLVAVDAAYQQSDADRTLLERSLELTSEELNDRYEQLLLAKEAAEAANRAKTTFLANMSHEIRTPMNGVLGMLQLALDLPVSSEMRDLLETAKSSAEHLLAILNDVLDVSKIEAQRMELEESAFDVRAMLAEVFRSFGLAVYKRGLDLIGVVDRSVPAVVRGDPLRLRQIATNLIGNAVKFTPRGEVIVALRFAALPGVASEVSSAGDRSGTLTLEVRDSGIGIERSKIERIFDSFAQADTSMTRRFGGTGLGLAISARLAELMHGKLEAESELGKGSTFRAHVRLGIEEPPPPPVLQGRAASLLIVEPNRRAADGFASAMTGEGYRADVACSMEEVMIARVEGRRYDLVLVDSALLGRDDPRVRSMFVGGGSERLILMSSPFDARANGAELAPAAIAMKPIVSSDLARIAAEVLGDRVKPEAAEVLDAPTSSLGVHGIRVLLAEDNAINQKLMMRMLERRGLKVTLVGDGRGVLSALERERFDVILMDISMPDIDGLEATRRIRARERGTSRRVPIIALTAHTMPGDAEQCLEAGIDAHVAKPVDVKKLFEAIRTLIVRSAF